MSPQPPAARPASPQSPAPPPLERGDRVPNFILPDVGGGMRMLYDLTKGWPGLIALIRADDPAAGAALRTLVERAPAATQRGVELYAVVEGTPEKAAALVKQSTGDGAPFPVFIDAEGKVNRVYPVAGARGCKTVVIDPNQRVLTAIADGDAASQTDRALQYLAQSWRAPKPAPAGRVAPVLLVPDVFDEAMRRTLIDAWHKDNAELGVSGTTDAVIYEKKKSRDHVVRDPELNRRISATLNRRIAPEVMKAFTFKGPYGFDGHIVLGYDAERNDFFGLHRDNLSPRTKHRRFAISLNLNDDFEGGALRFPEYGTALYNLEAGMACVFSCTLLHEALPVTRGRRLTLTTFMCDPTGPQPAPVKS